MLIHTQTKQVFFLWFDQPFACLHGNWLLARRCFWLWQCADIHQWSVDIRISLCSRVTLPEERVCWHPGIVRGCQSVFILHRYASRGEGVLTSRDGPWTSECLYKSTVMLPGVRVCWLPGIVRECQGVFVFQSYPSRDIRVSWYSGWPQLLDLPLLG